MATSAIPARAGGVHHRHGFALLALVLRAASWSLLLGFSGLLLVMVLVPRLGGATPYAVLTGSMRPGLPPGTLVVIKPVAAADVGVGTVITYQLHSGRSAVVTHRVVEVSHGPDGRPLWRTRGDANDATDPGWIRPVQLRGRLWYAVPYVGRLHVALAGGWHRPLALGTACCLFGYAGFALAGAVVDRRRAR